MIKIIIGVLILLVLFFIAVILIDVNRFVISYYEIKDNRIKHDMRFAVLADLHGKEYGEKNETLLEAIDAQNPDAVIIAGDMPTAKPNQDFSDVLVFLEKLSEKYPVYYGNGNHEYRLKLYPEVYGDMSERWQEALQKMGISPLCNESTKLVKAGIRIYGLEMDKRYYKRGKKLPMDENYLKQELGIADPSTYNVLIAHNPAYFKEYAAWGSDLVLSGHVHGGVMRLPVVRGVISPAFCLFPKYSCGAYQEGKSKMLVSAGLGVHTIPIRVFNPGELMILDLKEE